MKLHLRPADKLYQYTKKGKQVLCKRYKFVTISPRLDSLCFEVRKKARENWKLDIVNLDIVDIANINPEFKDLIAGIDRDKKGEQKDLIIGIDPIAVNEWIYAHELLHFLHPEIHEISEPSVNEEGVPGGLDISTLNALISTLFHTMIDHFINRLVYTRGFDINDPIESNLQHLELPIDQEIKRIHLMSNYLATFSMAKYVSEGTKLAPDFKKAKGSFDQKYPSPAGSLHTVILKMDLIEGYDFEKIKDFVNQTLGSAELLIPLYNFAKYSK
jgi:hypothetical protein